MKLLQHFKELTVRPKNAQELKGLILQLAIQGKLTANWREENPDVEPASELLKRIKEEKKQLVKDKKIRNEKPYSEINKRNLTKKVPLRWDFNYIRDISSVVTCGMASTPKYTETGRIFLSAKNVKPFTFKPEKHKFVSEETYQKIIKNSKPEKGDLLLTRVGAGIGEACVIDQDIDFAFYVSLTLIKPMKGIDSKYMLYWLSSKDGIKKVLDNIYGKGVSQGNLNVNQVRQFVMPIPPLEEQKEIVNVVETLFKEVAQLEQLTAERINLKEDFVTSALNQLTTNNANQEWTFLQDHFKSFFNEITNIKKLRETVLQLAVQGKLTADWRANHPDTEDASISLERIKTEKKLQTVKEEEIPFKLNSSWEWAKFIDVAKLRHGHQFRNYDFVEEGIPVIKIGQCKSDGTLDFSKCNYIDPNRKAEFENDLIFKGHLLMALTGGTLGKVTRVDKDYGILVQNYRVGNFFADERVITLDFLNVILESELFQSLVREKINQNAQPNIGKDSIEKIVMPIPPLEEQKAIVEKVNALMGLCDSLAQEVQQSQEHSAQLMQSVLREVFEGEKEVV
ncbi:hypothetical protein LPB136_13515 [Tenacibaculum todarodis]|uniref:Type I restriction modification DNA specificity domain-containing protein n=1 Tax=Tenacibaculum todarodis TaxID=1850252 RepID=A0A1L3JMG8_9FLAO|nr:restriction endonuclease subunit S [Tenacibaculum todarodis]APG66328.1 hypothetical protein LPB136_13515 [Tenacibaculum todarodis]